MKKNVLSLLCLVVAAFGRVILVPDSAATIQAGLGLAGSGDKVLVSPGTYSENLVWPSLDGVKLLSVAGPESTIVDGRQAGPCLVMSSTSLKRATRVEGLTFTNGYTAGSGAGRDILRGRSLDCRQPRHALPRGRHLPEQLQARCRRRRAQGQIGEDRIAEQGGESEHA